MWATGIDEENPVEDEDKVITPDGRKKDVSDYAAEALGIDDLCDAMDFFNSGNTISDLKREIDRYAK
jgi:hypothetical protein